MIGQLSPTLRIKVKAQLTGTVTMPVSWTKPLSILRLDGTIIFAQNGMDWKYFRAYPIEEPREHSEPS